MADVTDREVVDALRAVAFDRAPQQFWDILERELAAGAVLEEMGGIMAEILTDVARYALEPADESATAATTLKHLGGQHDQQTHAGSRGGGTIGVHNGTRKPWEVKDTDKANSNLIENATWQDSLPQDLQDRIDGGLTNLGVDQAQIEANIESVLKDAQTRVGEGETPDGQDWYDEANAAATRIGDEYGVDLDHSAGAIAAASPQQAWGDNVTSVEYAARAQARNHEVQVDDLTTITRTKVIDGKQVTKTMYEWAESEVDGRKLDGETRKMPSADELRGKRINDLDPYVAAAIIKAHGQIGFDVEGIGLNVNGKSLSTIDDLTGLPTPVKFTCGIQHFGRSVAILRGASPDAVLNGHKVRSFYNNIRDPQNPFDDVTVDSHAFSVGMGQKYSSGSQPYKYFSGAGVPVTDKQGNPVSWTGAKLPPVTSATYGVTGLYSAFADAYRSVGARYGLSARQVQAITWVEWRRQHPDRQRGAQMAREEGEA